ncbi:hypothetical protein LRP52_17760 [Photobacterium sp. ZSDE20]|uniref:Acid phosphatase n=1 Tax=Photobacterium pectinilyticum TaxID=2906793 RepID=A0ABT1N445_9GAMM|nr:hypothetical protein [Photobacterium sp. ZSDE20]MCQ1058634.1 hypothetical protein [Photobacterium sp. ZSDE20]MDD1824046.1 hypothetical protein [Photobacterium sp. ZSDE20]
MKKTAIALSVLTAITLSGCGSSSDDNPPPPSENSRSITVIDGYLGRAEVCVDRNANNVCDKDEFLGITNDDGTFTIPAVDSNYPVLTRAIAGFSLDSDRIGYVRNTYEMVANADSSVVTPFTTLAKSANMTVEELANELDLPTSVISGDYVSAKQGDNAEDAVVAHALARSLVNELPANAAELNGESLKEAAADINNAISSHVNDNGHDSLDDVDFVIDSSGDVVTEDVISDLQSYLIGDETVWNMVSLNGSYAQDEGIFAVELDEDKMCVTADMGEFCALYSVEGNVLSFDGESDEFIYTSSNIAFAVPAEGDLSFWTTDNLIDGSSMEFASTDFSDKTWFMVFDDATNQMPVPIFVEFQFKENGRITFVEDGEDDFYGDWAITSDGNLHITFDDETVDDMHPMTYSYVTTNGRLMIVSNLDHHANVFSIFTEDKALAENIIKQWEATN